MFACVRCVRMCACVWDAKMFVCLCVWDVRMFARVYGTKGCVYARSVRMFACVWDVGMFACVWVWGYVRVYRV